MNMRETETASVTRDPLSRALFIVWRGFVQGEAFREPLRKALAMFEEHPTRYCLSDARELGVLTDEDQTWLRDQWLPSAAKAGLTAIALLQPYSALARISLNAVLRFAEGIDIANFDSLAAAKEWLAVQRILAPDAASEREPGLWGGIFHYIEAVDNRKN